MNSSWSNIVPFVSSSGVLPLQHLSFFIQVLHPLFLSSLSLHLLLSLWRTLRPYWRRSWRQKALTCQWINVQECHICNHGDPIIRSASRNVTVRSAELHCAVTETKAHPAAFRQQLNIWVLSFKHKSFVIKSFGFLNPSNSEKKKNVASVTPALAIADFPHTFLNQVTANWSVNTGGS